MSRSSLRQPPARGLRLGEKQRIRDRRIFFGLYAVPEKVGADQIAFLGQVVIQFHNSVVLAIVIVQVQSQFTVRPGPGLTGRSFNKF